MTKNIALSSAATAAGRILGVVRSVIGSVSTKGNLPGFAVTISDSVSTSDSGVCVYYIVKVHYLTRLVYHYGMSAFCHDTDGECVEVDIQTDGRSMRHGKITLNKQPCGEMNPYFDFADKVKEQAEKWLGSSVEELEVLLADPDFSPYPEGEKGDAVMVAGPEHHLGRLSYYYCESQE